MLVAQLGIPQIDRILGPLPAHASVLIANEPGLEAEAFLYQTAGDHLAHGRKVVYLALSRAPGAVLRCVSDLGFRVTDAAAPIFVDAFSGLLGARSGAAYEVQDPTDEASLLAALERASTEHPDAVLLVDSLSTLVDHWGEARFARAYAALHAALRRFTLSVSLFTRWSYPEAVRQTVEAADAVIAVRGVEGRVTVSQFFEVEKVAWRRDHDARPRPFRLERPGGVLVYLPKIAITGAAGAGKSTFIRSVSEAAVSVDRLGTTVALDHGRVTLDGLTADLFGTPGEERFEPLLPGLLRHALGVLVLVDSTRPESLVRTQA
ncbi:MAG: ATPase domain-containing protein, partial [Myxococcota bacterium]